MYIIYSTCALYALLSGERNSSIRMAFPNLLVTAVNNTSDACFSTTAKAVISAYS